MIIVEVLYLFCAVLLAVYGFNSLMLTLFYRRVQGRRIEPPPLPDPPPRVCVQLPIYNERHVAARLIKAVAALDYPHDRLQIQVLDDSTDETQRIVQRAVARYRRRGLDIVQLHRKQRQGFKAGALAEGLAQVNAELIAIFDADFIPPPDFLRRTVSYFSDPRLGCVQTRWDHLNRDYSPLTRAQAMGIDAHFVIEQTARHRAGFFINFNGTAGLWRRACIEAVGGWQGDTLTEDLDLSYRAQLRGWRFMYLPQVAVPAEIPAQLEALKRQQFRWAKGSIQTAIKLMGPLLRSTQPWPIKLEGAIHLTGYLVHPLMLLMLLLTLPVSFIYRSWVFVFLPFVVVAAIGPPLLNVVAQLDRKRRWRDTLPTLFSLLLLGTGLSANCSRAVAEAVLGIGSEFRRTPKFAVRRRSDRWQASTYALHCSPMVWIELFLSAFALFSLAMSWRWQGWRGLSPWLMLYTLGFAYVGGLGLAQAWHRQRTRQLASHRSELHIQRDG